LTIDLEKLPRILRNETTRKIQRCLFEPQYGRVDPLSMVRIDPRAPTSPARRRANGFPESDGAFLEPQIHEQRV
jgi:hypothetical protein